jgi:hypothetical protein
MKGGKRKLSQWNLFVQKVYKEGKAKDSNYEFKQALSDASKRKSEMGSMKSSSGRGSMKSRKVSRKSRGKRSMAVGKSRKNRKH